LTVDEHAQAVAAAVQAVAGRVPVIAGCTASATSMAVSLATRSAQAGADALLCAAPPYSKPTHLGIAAHFRAVAHAADLPLVLYDVPSRSSVAIADATVADLFERDLIGAIKDATADIARPPRLRALCGDGLVQMSGDDATAAAHRAMGGHGCISVTANVTPILCALLHRAWDVGDSAEFARLRDLLDPLHAVLFIESNPIPVKAAMEALGLCSATHRLPLTRATAATWDRLRDVLAEVMRAEEGAARRRHFAIAS
jgi:4-hydroxy-tetrahydrodipicolinate synthase